MNKHRIKISVHYILIFGVFCVANDSFSIIYLKEEFDCILWLIFSPFLLSVNNYTQIFMDQMHYRVAMGAYYVLVCTRY